MANRHRSKRRAGGEIGYGKPPRHTQFKAGQSGNPKGRTRGTKNARASLLKAAAELVNVQDKGRTRRFSKEELANVQLVNRAAKGELRAIEVFFKELTKLKAAQANADDPESGRAKVVMYVPDHSRKVIPGANAVAAPLDGLIERIEENDEVMSVLGEEERKQFTISLAKVARELDRIGK